jgi:hypothetical protein
MSRCAPSGDKDNETINAEAGECIAMRGFMFVGDVGFGVAFIFTSRSQRGSAH